MWSKTKWALEQRLADSLKNRVSFSFSVKRTFYSELHVMYIHVDGDVWCFDRQPGLNRCGNGLGLAPFFGGRPRKGTRRIKQ